VLQTTTYIIGFYPVYKTLDKQFYGGCLRKIRTTNWYCGSWSPSTDFCFRQIKHRRWRWTIVAIGVTLVIADFLYFYALSLEGAMISMISALRRSSVLLTFTLGALIFKEKNLKQKGIYLLGILAGILLITLGSN